MAATVKDATRIDDHTRGVNFAGHDALAFDLSFHLRAFAEDDRLFRDDVAFDVAVNAERSSNRQGSFERYALVDESCPFFTCAILCGAGPLPCHDKPPLRDCSTLAAHRDKSTQVSKRVVE